MANSVIRPAAFQSDWRVSIDAATSLPSLIDVLHDVRVLLEQNGYLGIVFIDLEPLNDIEADCGSAVYNQLIHKIASQIIDMRHNVVRGGDLVCAVRPYGEQVAIFLGANRDKTPLGPVELEGIADRVYMSLAPKIAELTRPFGSKAQFRLGYALVLTNPMIQGERLVYRGLDRAAVMAEDYSRRVHARGRERLRDLIVNRELQTVFQPILRLGTDGGVVRAYEALIRGPTGSDLFSPAMLFNLASNTELAAELDRACFECTLKHAVGIPDDTLLFANVLPAVLNDQAFRARVASRELLGVDPTRVVLELNEAYAIRSYEVLAAGIAELRSHGVRVAVDDLGAGYANLDHVLKLEPDFLKLDISLIRGVHLSPVKQALISSMVSVGKAVNATVIAEGVEEKEELDALVSLGITWGQGFLFARPGPGFGTPTLPVPRG